MLKRRRAARDARAARKSRAAHAARAARPAGVLRGEARGTLRPVAVALRVCVSARLAGLQGAVISGPGHMGPPGPLHMDNP